MPVDRDGWPTEEDYARAVSAGCPLEPAELETAWIALDERFRPEVFSRAGVVGFHAVTESGEAALLCFTGQADSKYHGEPFRLYQRGLWVDGHWWPIVVGEWRFAGPTSPLSDAAAGHATPPESSPAISPLPGRDTPSAPSSVLSFDKPPDSEHGDTVVGYGTSPDPLAPSGRLVGLMVAMLAIAVTGIAILLLL